MASRLNPSSGRGGRGRGKEIEQELKRREDQGSKDNQEPNAES